jgi:hypothetical protein
MEEAPVQVDGNAYLKVIAVWDTSTVDSVNNFVSLPNAKVILSSEYGIRIEYTNANGVCELTHLPSSTYGISVRAIHPVDDQIFLVGNIKNVEVNSGLEVIDTLIAKAISSTGIAINELYVGGPVNNIFFFYDQFIELYNSSDSVKYLDGAIVMRVSGNNDGRGPGADEDDDGDIDGVTYIFKFPGNPGDKNSPIGPKSFLVLAQDAIDHRTMVPTSIDLSNADWEFYNQLSPTDFDNPNVPNLLNIRSDKTVDFMINLSADVIVVATGVDTAWSDGVDIETILDGVEYQSKSTSTLTLDDRVDRGWVQSPPKYGGQSMQRRDPGVDTNDGTLDWEILPSPTAGYQK